MATTLVLGAARNGKSDYAAALLAHYPAVTYVATGPKVHDAPDQAWADRIVEQRARRPESWDTVETTALSRALLLSRRPVLIDTLSHWVWSVLEEHDLWASSTGAIEQLEPTLDELLVVYRSLSHDVVAISDEVGWGREPTNAREETYREVLAHVNNWLKTAREQGEYTGRSVFVRKDGTLQYLRPDGKAQVTVEYDGSVPVRVDAVVVSTQHAEDVTQEQIREDIIERVIKPVIPAEMLDSDTKYFVNPTGRFVIGGPAGDSGLTGRKIIVDTYGGYARHGGGAFSGKDPSKVDRSAAYAVRHIAKNVVAAGLAERCEIEVAYAIGVSRPVSVYVDTFGTGAAPDDKLARRILEVFDLRPAAIIERLGLCAPIYAQTASYGHFGRPDLDLPWERLDMVDKLA